MANSPKKQWPTWMIVVAIIILIPPVVWALSIFVDIIIAMSIGGILAVVAIIALFVYLQKRVDAER